MAEPLLAWILLHAALLTRARASLTLGDQSLRRVVCRPLEPDDCPDGVPLADESLFDCRVCVPFVDEGRPCRKSDGRVRCRPGFACRGEICQSDKKPSCTYSYEVKLANQGQGLVSEDSWLPRCTASGHYRAKQLLSNKAICVDPEGHRLFGQIEMYSSANMTCGCSRALNQKKLEEGRGWSVERREHCTARGDFDPLQCVGQLCYCGHPSTGKALGPMVHVDKWKLLPCHDSRAHGEKYERKCESEMIRINRLKYQFFRKGMEIVGLDYVDCDPDGSFGARQCSVDKCFCVGLDGKSFKSYQRERNGREHQMHCRCARDEYLAEVFHAQYARMRCDDGGDYYPVQCFDGECVCVDSEGSPVKVYGLVNSSAVPELEPDCLKVRKLHDVWRE